MSKVLLRNNCLAGTSSALEQREGSVVQYLLQESRRTSTQMHKKMMNQSSNPPKSINQSNKQAAIQPSH